MLPSSASAFSGKVHRVFGGQMVGIIAAAKEHLKVCLWFDEKCAFFSELSQFFATPTYVYAGSLVPISTLRSSGIFEGCRGKVLHILHKLRGYPVG